jgi:hypothetical protein
LPLGTDPGNGLGHAQPGNNRTGRVPLHRRRSGHSAQPAGPPRRQALPRRGLYRVRRRRPPRVEPPAAEGAPRRPACRPWRDGRVRRQGRRVPTSRPGAPAGVPRRTTRRPPTPGPMGVADRPHHGCRVHVTNVAVAVRERPPDDKRRQPGRAAPLTCPGHRCDGRDCPAPGGPHNRFGDHVCRVEVALRQRTSAPAAAVVRACVCAAHRIVPDELQR